MICFSLAAAAKKSPPRNFWCTPRTLVFQTEIFGGFSLQSIETFPKGSQKLENLQKQESLRV